MKVEQHIAVSVGVSGAIFVITRSWPITLSSLFVGIFLDLDHLIEYVREFGFRFNLKRFLNASYDRQYKKVVLILHAWEWIPLIAAAIWWTDWNPWVSGAAIGWLQHMFCDQLFNTPKPWAYSILWRRIHHFDHQRTFPKYDR